MFHLPSCSKPLQKLSQLPIGLPAQSVRALCPRQVFFSRLPQSIAKKPPLIPPRCICKLSTVSARSRRSYGKIEDYDPKSLSAYGFILPLMPHFHPVSPTPPHPAPRALCNRVSPGEAITQLKKYWAKSVDEFSP